MEIQFPGRNVNDFLYWSKFSIKTLIISTPVLVPNADIDNLVVNAQYILLRERCEVAFTGTYLLLLLS